MARYILTTNGHGSEVRPARTHADGTTYAVVRTASGSWVSGQIVRVWNDEKAAERDSYSPEMRWNNLRRLDYNRGELLS